MIRTITCVLFLIATVLAQKPTVERLDEVRAELRPFLDALIAVESGGDDAAVGDGGKAIGAYQIWSVYWQDATEWCTALKGTWADCYERQHAERIVVAYWHRYARTALRNGDHETLARIHNGGPRGAEKRATEAYWGKVSKQLAR